jgi:hypothetical protein
VCSLICEKRLFASSCLCVCRRGKAGLKWTDVHIILSLNVFRKRVEKIQVLFKFDNNNYFIVSRSFLLRVSNVLGNSCRENQTTHFVFLNSLPRTSCRLRDSVGKYCRVGQAPYDDIIRRMRTACWKLRMQTQTHNM